MSQTRTVGSQCPGNWRVLMNSAKMASNQLLDHLRFVDVSLQRRAICIGMVAILFSLSMLLTSCDAFWKVTVENHQARDLHVFLDNLDQHWVGGCTVDTKDFVLPPPDKNVHFQFEDGQGQVVYETIVEAEQVDRGSYSMKVSIPERFQGECPDLQSTTWGQRQTPEEGTPTMNPTVSP